MKKALYSFFLSVLCSLSCQTASAELFSLATFSKTHFAGWSYREPLSTAFIDLKNVRFFNDSGNIIGLYSPLLDLNNARGIIMSFTWIVEGYTENISDSDPVVELLDVNKSILKSAEYILLSDALISNYIAIAIEVPNGISQGYIRLSAPKASVDNYAYIQEASLTGSTLAGVPSQYASGIHIYGNDGKINIDNAEGKNLKIYNSDGVCMVDKKCEASSSITVPVNGPKGVYIVKIDGLPAVKILL